MSRQPARPRQKAAHALHGNVVHASGVVLLLIDVINDLEFPEGRQVRPHALRMARALVKLKARARRQGIPTIYVNDNFGIWHSDFQHVVDHCLRDGVCGAPVVEQLVPNRDDYVVLKPKHSGFYCTTLDLLLHHLGAHTLILTGLAGNICVLFTANDAYMRDYKLVVPSDGCASNTLAENRHALRQMSAVLGADTRLSARINLKALSRDSTQTVHRARHA